MEKPKGVPKKAIALFLAVIFLASGLTGLYSYSLGFGEGLNTGLRQGQLALLENIRRQLGDSNLKIEYMETSTGLNISVIYVPTNTTVWQSVMRWDCYVYKNGHFIAHHPMTIVNQGRNWIADDLFTDYTGAYRDTYLRVSNDSSSVSLSWVELPNCITDGGLAPANGTWLDTGTGTGNLTNTWTASATRSTKLYGLGYGTSFTDSLLIAEQQGIGNQVDLVSGDNLTVCVMYNCTG